MMIDPKGSRPEALAKFAEVARHDDGQPVREGVEATKETSAIPTNPGLKQDAATKVLREGVLHRNQGAKKAIQKLPDRRRKMVKGVAVPVPAKSGAPWSVTRCSSILP